MDVRFLLTWLSVAILASLFVPSVESGAGDTDFERSRAGMWSTLTGDNIIWTPVRRRPRGPRGDHTTGKGVYVYAESNYRAGIATLYSNQWIDPSEQPRCFHFYYAMYGEQRSSLLVKLDPEGGQLNSYPAFFVNSTDIGDHRDRWIRADVEIRGVRRKKPVIKAKFRPGHRLAGIALDDIYVSRGSCECRDSHPYLCSRWQRNGSCNKNTKWMSKYCRRSCRTCDCKDRHPLCVEWAMKGRCRESDVQYYCPYNCSTCHCRDKKESCPSLREYGYCWKRKQFMQDHCRRTCGWC